MGFREKGEGVVVIRWLGFLGEYFLDVSWFDAGMPAIIYS